MVIKIPQSGQFSQLNQTDLFGNIWYTKNINFNEKGYLKLASRTVMIKNSTDDAAFGIPISYGRRNTTGNANLVTSDQEFDLFISPTNISATENALAPSLSIDSWGRWWQNRWYVTTDNDLYYYNGAAWTSVDSFSSNVIHALEVFRNRKSLCVSNGNEVLQYDTSHSAQTALTIPEDYEIVGLSYNNNMMGIITTLSDSVSGQNQNAFFFTWDGSQTSNSEGYDTGSERILGIYAYKASWILITRTGEILYFNGGGFQVLTTIPLYYMDILWEEAGSKSTFGDIIKVQGDLILFNIPSRTNQYGELQQRYVENFPGGVLCYDPNIGLYHKYSPSNSQAYMIEVSASNINTTTGVFTRDFGTIPDTGNPIRYTFSTSSTSIGVQMSRQYYVIRLSSSTFKLANTYEDAINLIGIIPTSQGTGTNNFMAINLVDYGTSYFSDSGMVEYTGNQNTVTNDVIFGDRFRNFSNTNHYGLMISTPGFENRGYFVTSKIPSGNILDTYQKIYIKYRPLKDNDQIIIKYKDKDYTQLPVSTPQGNNEMACTWSSNTVLTTTADFSEALTQFNNNIDLECEITSGAGAGQMAQISSISLNAGTYTVTLTDAMFGATNGSICNILVNNWKQLGVITSADSENIKEFSIGLDSKWCKFKVELRGIETTIEELQIINLTQQPSK